MKIDLRKKLLVYPELQGNLIVYMMWLGFVVLMIFVAGSVFCLSETIAILHNVELASDTQLSTIIVSIWLKVCIITLFSVIGVIGAFGYFSLRFSNKIAGPTLQMKNKLTKYIESGEFESIKLREKDYFKDLAELINKAVAKNSEDKK